MSHSLSAVVVAAGRSQRMGFDKLLTPLAGRPLLLHTLIRLAGSGLLDEIILVVRAGAEEEMSQVVAPLAGQISLRLVPGGDQRQDSVFAGLQAVAASAEFVMVHDAARPFVTRELIELVLAGARLSDAAVCGAPCSDSLKEVGEDGLVRRTVNRAQLWAVQTPQIFRRTLLLEAYRSARAGGQAFTDDTAVVEHFGHAVRTVLYPEINLKVTTPLDWKLAELFLEAEKGQVQTAQELRRHLHDLNNHLTPLLGYAYLMRNEFPDEETRAHKFSVSIQSAGERCQATALALQKLVRQAFPQNSD